MLGVKHDSNKNRLDLIPIDALWEVGQVYSMGAKKYDDWNWAGGINYSRVASAMMRHLFKWLWGETYDSEDGQHHLSSVVWGGLTLLHYDLNKEKYEKFDDRHKGKSQPWVDQKEVKTNQNPLETIVVDCQNYQNQKIMNPVAYAKLMSETLLS